MPFSILETPNLETVLNSTPKDRVTEQALAEYARLREVNYHLATHLKAVKMQTDATLGGIQSLFCQLKPNSASEFLRRRLD